MFGGAMSDGIPSDTEVVGVEGYRPIHGGTEDGGKGNVGGYGVQCGDVVIGAEVRGGIGY